MADRESITKLKERLEGVKDAETLKAIYREEATNPEGKRDGAISAIVKRGEAVGMDEAALRASDAKVSETTAGAQPLTTALTEEDRASHAELIERLERLEAAGTTGRVGDEFDAREEMNKLWRGLEYVANQLNLKLPS